MKKNLLILCIFIGIAGFTTAIEIDLDSAAELALGNNRTLLAGYSEQNALDRAKRSGWNQFLPDLYVGTGLTRSNEVLPTATSEWNYAFAVGASLDISGGSAYRIGASRLAYEQGLIGLAEMEHSVAKDARKAFLRLLLIRDTIEIYELMVETAQARYERAARRFELGDARKVDMLSFQVSWQNMLPELTDLQNLYEIDSLEFRRILGLPENETMVLVGEIPAEEVSWDAQEIIRSRLGLRYDVRNAQKTIETIKNEKGRRVSEYLTPTFTAAYEYAPAVNDPFGSPSGWADYNGGLTLWLNMPLDGLIPGAQKNIAVRELNDALDAAELRLADALQAGAIQIESAVRNLNKSSAVLRSLELNVELAEESYDLISRSYDVGEADYIQVQTADDEMNTARLQLINERYNYAASLQDLDYAVAAALDITPRSLDGNEKSYPYPTNHGEELEED